MTQHALLSRQLQRSTFGIRASAQQPRSNNKSSKQPRVVKLPSIGTSVNFVDVLQQTPGTEPVATAAPVVREEHLTRLQRGATRRMCAQLQVPPRVAIAIAAQAPYLAANGIEQLTDTINLYAGYFNLSVPALGKVLSLRPDFMANPQSLQQHVLQMSALLSMDTRDLPSLICRAPELVAYSPEFFASELQALAGLLHVEVYEAAALVRQEPRALVVGIKRLSDKLEQLSLTLNKPYPAVAVVARTCPSVLFLNLRRLQKKREFLEEVCSSHPCWQQQLAEMPAVVMTELLKNYGTPTFMRLRFLARHGHQPSTNLLAVFTTSNGRFDREWPGFLKWADWNTPSYLFE